MRWMIVLACLTAACAPPLSPSPTPTPTVMQIPAAISVSATDATSAHDTLLNVLVSDSAGKGVMGETVFLSTTAGTLNHPTVTTGPTGTAQAILNTTRSATITAQVRSFTATAKATAYSLPLSVSARATPQTPNKGDGVTFSAAVTGGSAPFTYVWTFGDNSTGAGQVTTHRYFSDGSKSINVTVTDADGRTGSTSTGVTVQTDLAPPAATCATDPSLCPVAVLSATLNCTANTTLILPCNVTATYGGAALPSASVTAVSWDWGDGDTTGATVAVSHTYAMAGSYVVFVTVTANLPIPSGGSATITTSRAVTVPKP